MQVLHHMLSILSNIICFGRTVLSALKVFKKFRSRVDAGHHQMVPSSRAGDVQQMPLGAVHLVKVGLVGDRLDT